MAPSHLTHWSGELPLVRLCLSAAMQQISLRGTKLCLNPFVDTAQHCPVLLTFLHDVS